MFIRHTPGFQRMCAGVLALGLLIAAAPVQAKPTSSILSGALIVGVGLKSPPIDTTSTPPAPIMTLDFSGVPYQTVVGNIIPTSLTPITVFPSVTITWPIKKKITDTCLDSPTVSSVMTSSGTFDPVTGNITGLALTITLQHAVGPTTGTTYGTILCNGSFRDVITVVLSTTGSAGVASGAALNRAGSVTLVGMASVVTPTETDPTVPVSVSGTLAPLPDRTVGCNGAIVPDVTEATDLQWAQNELQNAGLQPVLQYVGGPNIPDPYVSFQHPAAGDCVPLGTTVHLTVRKGPVP